MGQGALRRSRGDEREDDVKRQVDSDVNHQKPIYQLINVKTGGGRLVEIIKTRARHSASLGSLGLAGSYSSSQSFCDSKRINKPWTTAAELSSTINELNESSIEAQIRELVEPLLYNRGEGKLVALSELWRYRFGQVDNNNSEINKTTGKEQEEAAAAATAAPTRGVASRLVCWKLEERGFVGETALHICFLLSTPTHMILAHKLLAMFPALINDIYTCDEYFGESSLHMAIVNENIKIVKLLLDHGANVHERCLGSFFLPGDLKDKANGTARKWLLCSHELPDSSQLEMVCPPGMDLEANHFNTNQTNYDGHCYWGEYPLSFAASLGLQDCYKLLLAKGADPNRQDSQGNSSLHLAVIANRVDMFDLCYSNGANLNLYNKLQLTPLALAAKLCKVDMFFHILTIQRRVNWILCNVAFIETPLRGLDSINCTDGACDDHSVLSIVVSGNSNEHLQMLDGLVSELLQVKWRTFARQKFNSWLGAFLLFLFISTVAYISRFFAHQHDSNHQHFKYNNKLINQLSESMLVCFVLYYLWIILARIVPPSSADRGANSTVNTSSPLNKLAWLVAQAPEVAMLLFTCLLILTCIPLRALQWTWAENFVAAIVMFVLPLKLLFFCRASQSLGPFIVMIYKILMNDVLCFVVFLIIFVAGFSQSFLIIFKTHNEDNNYFANLFDGIISMHMMALNEFSLVFDHFNSTAHPGLAKLLFCVYMILVSILLINMLIAMLGKTYQDISGQPNESRRQWARALLTVERMWSSGDRLQMLERYSHLDSDELSRESNNDDDDDGSKCRYYSSTWALTGQNLNEIKQLKELSQENRTNARRLGAKRRL